uniref:Uncharacterized protein n=1 Tax=Glossina pallidipes TaxID=7398 RepID=A0A1A9ZLW3_GLOPL
MKFTPASVKYLSRKYGKERINKFLICDVIKSLRKEGKQRSHVAISTNFSVREDKPGKSRPSDFGGEGDESLTIRMLADNFNADHTTIVCRLNKLKTVQDRLIISFENL